MTTRADRLVLERGQKRLLDDVSIELPAGTLTAVVGPNGAGKSTLLRVLSGEHVPTSGTLEILGRPLGSWDARALGRRRAVVSQHVEVAFAWPAGALVALGRLPHETSAADDARIVNEALARVGLAKFAERSSAELSGGELQRVHLARAIAQLDGEEPGLLLLDEPTSSLDPAQQHHTLRTAKDLAESGHAVLCILHDLSLAARYADRALVLDAGRCVRAGAAADVLEPGLLADVFAVRTLRHTGATPDEGGLFVLGPLQDFGSQPTRSDKQGDTR